MLRKLSYCKNLKEISIIIYKTSANLHVCRKELTQQAHHFKKTLKCVLPLLHQKGKSVRTLIIEMYGLYLEENNFVVYICTRTHIGDTGFELRALCLLGRHSTT
jgi:hypothetical protein